MSDLSCIYYTANVIEEYFATNARNQLVVALPEGTPIICVSKQPMDFGDKNIVRDTPRSHIDIYRDALAGAMAATTKYIALCEDDVLYSPEHFKYRSSSGKFAYNLGAWSIFTWSDPPMFTHKGKVRRNLNGLICERELFIEAIDERFEKNADHKPISLWAEPGKYEGQLGVVPRETEEFYTNPPNIVFSHEDELSFNNLGVKKRVGEFRAYDIPYWGSARFMLKKIYRRSS